MSRRRSSDESPPPVPGDENPEHVHRHTSSPPEDPVINPEVATGSARQVTPPDPAPSSSSIAAVSSSNEVPPAPTPLKQTIPRKRAYRSYEGEPTTLSHMNSENNSDTTTEFRSRSSSFSVTRPVADRRITTPQRRAAEIIAAKKESPETTSNHSQIAAQMSQQLKKDGCISGTSGLAEMGAIDEESEPSSSNRESESTPESEELEPKIKRMKNPYDKPPSPPPPSQII